MFRTLDDLYCTAWLYVVAFLLRKYRGSYIFLKILQHCICQHSVF